MTGVRNLGPVECRDFPDIGLDLLLSQSNCSANPTVQITYLAGVKPRRAKRVKSYIVALWAYNTYPAIRICRFFRIRLRGNRIYTFILYHLCRNLPILDLCFHMFPCQCSYMFIDSPNRIITAQMCSFVC